MQPKETEEHQKRLEETIQNLIDSSPYMIIIIDRNGKVLNLNSKTLEFLVSTKINFFGKDFRDLDFFSQLKPDKLKEINDAIFRNNISKSIEFKILHPKYKKQIWVSLKASITNLYNEKIIQVFIQDISTSKKTEQKLQQSQKKNKNLSEELETIIDRVPALIFYKDTKNNYIRVNKYVADAHGMKKEELKGKNCFEIYPKEQAQKYWKDDLEVIKSGLPKLNIEEIWETKDGLKWVLTNKIPYTNDSSDIIGIIGISINITDRIIAEQKLRDSEKKYRNLIETSSMGLMEIDLTKGGVIYINPRLLGIIGYTQEELKEENLFFRAVYPGGLTNIKKLQTEKNLEFRVINKEGKIKWLAGKTLPHFNEEGNLTTLRLWLQDITERREIEEIKSNLLTRFSHEFKTPLISIKGFADFLMIESSKNFDDETISFLKRIKEGSDRLKILVDHFIEVTRLNKHLVGINLNWENLTDIIQDCLTEIEGMVKLRNHTLNIELHDKLDVKCDREKIYNVIINLLQNAIKFTPKGGNITVQSHITKKSIIISIKDNGIGLQNDEINQIFRPFGKIEKYGRGWDIISDGMGLGLYYSKEILDLHKGKIWVKSKGKNKGSTFYISLPIIERN